MIIRWGMVLVLVSSWGASRSQAVDVVYSAEVSLANRYVLEGVDILPDADGVVAAGVSVDARGLGAGAEFLQGIGDSYNELSLYLEFVRDAKWVNGYVGAQFLTYPAGEADPNSWELYVGFDTAIWPGLTLFGEWVQDVDDLNGGFLEIGLATDLPSISDVIIITPYIQLGVDAGYVSGPRRLAENNLQTGVVMEWHATDHLCVTLGLHHSFALTNLDRIGEGDVTWVQGGVAWEL